MPNGLDSNEMELDDDGQSKLMNGQGELTIPSDDEQNGQNVNEDVEMKDQSDTAREDKAEDRVEAVPAPATADPSLINGSINGVVPGAVTATNGSLPQNGGGGSSDMPSKTAVNKRIDVDRIMAEFQKSLGDNWDRYREVITQFLIGVYIFLGDAQMSKKSKSVFDNAVFSSLYFSLTRKTH